VTTVGIVGGGQLGRMLALAGVPLGVRCVCLEPGADPPAAAVADVVRGAYGDRTALGELARRCDVVTVELEHVDVDGLAWLAERVPVRPGPAAVALAQDRLLEKQALQDAGVATAAFATAGPSPRGFPGGTIVKRRTGGYDGRGQVRVDGPVDVGAVEAELGGPCIAEAVVAFSREVSVIAARGLDGAVACYPVVENHHVGGILRETVAPAAGADQVAAEQLVANLLEAWSYVGVLAVELFEVEGRLVANEVAPRVHNSGHWTIEGAVTSQFEQHLRAICGLPLGDPSPRGHSAMVNLIGVLPPVADLLAVPGAHVHLYGKAPRPARKIGHVTVHASGPAERDARLARVREIVG
jgi:5-(carboxyamino)imidazole ribonucleotide synthase